MKRMKHLDPLITQALKASFKDGKLLEPEAQRLVSAFKKLPKSEAIYLLSEYLKGLKRELAFHELEIESAIELSQDEINQIKRKIAAKNSITTTRTVKNLEILGGVRARVADTVYDFSLKQRIAQVKEAIHG